MRGGLFAVAIFFAGAAHAQEAEGPAPDPAGVVGPFHLGMAQQDAVAIAPDAPWAIGQSLTASEYVERVPYLEVGPRHYAVHLHFDRGRVSMIRLGDARPMATSALCEAAFTAAIEAFEPSVGVFAGRALGHETGDAREELRTQAGSRIRFYTQPETGFRTGHANIRALTSFIIARSELRRRASGSETSPATVCSILFEFQVDPFEPPTDAEFAMAQSIDSTEAPVWLDRPDGHDFARVYPLRALARRREGRVVLDCLINGDGTLACRVAEEDPPGWEFGDAARLISTAFRMAMPGGSATHRRIRIPIRFMLR